MLAIVCAMPSEAAALRVHFRLKYQPDLPFSIWKNERIVLAVSGIGLLAMRYACSFLAGKFPIASYLNVGIAGHKSKAIGSGMFINHLMMDKKEPLYPTPIFSAPYHSCQTVLKPSATYPKTSLVDMEGFAFFQTATFFTSIDLVHLYKIVSDNQTTPFVKDRSYVQALVRGQLASITTAVEHLISLLPGKRPSIPDIFNKWRWTVSEQMQLKKLIKNAPEKKDFSALENLTKKECLRALKEMAL